MRWRTLLGGSVGLAALGAAYVYTYYPGVALSVPVLAAVPSAFGTAKPAVLLAGLGGFLMLYAALAAWNPFARPRDPPTMTPAERFAERQERPPEFVHGDDRAGTAAAMDVTVGRAVRGRGDALTETRETLRATAVAVLERESSGSREDASGAVADGSWTDDRVAAAFLGGSDGPSYPLLDRLRYWVDADATRERRIERTLAAIEARRDSDE